MPDTAANPADPAAHATEAGPLVRYEWTLGDHWYHRDLCHPNPDDCPRDSAHLLVWHHCALLAASPGPWSGWRAAGVPDHTVITPEPLTLVASLYWPDCCGLHGWITEGKWINA